MRAVNNLRIGNNNVFMGPGPKILLQSVERTASLRKACVETGISYTKALRMLRRLDTELGFAVVDSAKGGNERGGTVLTAQGVRLLRAYEEIEAETACFAQKLVDEKLGYLKR